ncbi:hypothetical protein RFI_23740 [Reticulomyxa filosa]|uniref:Transmembrane protein n=1 Tax=Reticulomyxa filosa TaxID=46433 RepID=X6MIX9_RETFI|nr:hypothetical protein RFI_23740 [Reticulomyxa filosa]|eukprot:ETO13631.1 hypothetical protein RFI_23740 [Reticulomyxa filosa]
MDTSMDAIQSTEDESESTNNSLLQHETRYLKQLDVTLSKLRPFEMRNMEDVVELIVPAYILLLVNVYLSFVGSSILYAFGALLVISTFFVIWHKLSFRIGLLAPLLLPLVIIIVEMTCFLLICSVCTLYHWKDNYLSLATVSFNILVVVSLFSGEASHKKSTKLSV